MELEGGREQPGVLEYREPRLMSRVGGSVDDGLDTVESGTLTVNHLGVVLSLELSNGTQMLATRTLDEPLQDVDGTAKLGEDLYQQSQ